MKGDESIHLKLIEHQHEFELNQVNFGKILLGLFPVSLPHFPPHLVLYCKVLVFTPAFIYTVIKEPLINLQIYFNLLSHILFKIIKITFYNLFFLRAVSWGYIWYKYHIFINLCVYYLN